LSEFRGDIQAAGQDLRLAAAKPTGRPELELCSPMANVPDFHASLAQARWVGRIFFGQAAERN
jgi:hypothetical protein